MTLEIVYKKKNPYATSYVEKNNIVEIRDFRNKKDKYVIISVQEYEALLKEIENLKNNPPLFN